MTTGRRLLAGLALLALAGSAAAKPEDSRGLARALAEKLHAAKPGAPQARTHSTDFAGENIGCITMPRREMRSFGYPGHAFVCEEAGGEVLGAVLDRFGYVRCHIAGEYVGDDCYEIDLCDNAETLCVR